MSLYSALKRTPNSPPLLIEPLALDSQRNIFVVRDDYLPAGTKQRAIIPFLEELKAEGIHHLIYASPFAGFAQIALAYGCNAVGLECTLFCEKDPAQAGLRAHEFTAKAESWGAKVQLVESLAEGEELASVMSERGEGYKIPLGFHCRQFQHHFQEVVSSSLVKIAKEIGHYPQRAWLPVGSGTLARAFAQAAPASIELCCVDVRVLPSNDLRIQQLHSIPRIRFHSAEEKFHERATLPPPLPSNIHYDAKLWKFIQAKGRDGDLWWNVAR